MHSEFDERVRLIQDIIRTGREYLGMAPMDHDRLSRQALAFFPKLQRIPTARLMECFESVTDQGIRSAIQPVDLLRAWEDLRPREIDSAKTQVINGQVVYTCHHCEDLGYQITRRPDGGTAARGCVCENCPPKLRSAEPLAPPYWAKGMNGVWYRVDDIG